MSKKIDVNQSNVLLYARVSSKEQEQGYSLEAQKTYLRDYANKNGLMIVKEFIEAETAKKSGRPLFNQMLVYLDKHPDIRTIIVEKTDRLYRNFKDFVILEDYNLQVHLVKEGQILDKDSKSHEKFIHGIKVLMAKNYIDNLSEEVKKGLAQKVREGGYPRSAPMGYINNLNTRTIEIDHEVAPTIKKLFEWGSTGQYSLVDLRRQAKNEGLLDGFSKYKISKSTIHKMLQNPVYYGKVLFKGELYNGNHDPIITEVLFHKVQEALRARLHPFKRTKDRFTFTGTFQCSKCGCAISAELRKKKYVYYHCTKMRGPCDNTPHIREEAVEEQFLKLLVDIQINEDQLHWIKDQLKASYEQEKVQHQYRINTLNTQIDQLQHRINQTYEDKLDGTITESFWKEKFKSWHIQKQQLTYQLMQEQQQNQRYFEKGIQALELASKAHDIYLQQDKSGRQKLIRFFLSNNPNQNSTITGKICEFELKKLFKTVLEAKESKMWLGWMDSNHRMAVPKTAALPLGDTPLLKWSDVL